MKFKTWFEQFQPALPWFQQEDPPNVGRYKSKESYLKAMGRGGRDTERAAELIVSAPPNSLHAPANEKIADIMPNALIIPEFQFPSGTIRPEMRIAFVFLNSEPNSSYQTKKQYRLLAYWQGRNPVFDKEVVFDGCTRPIGGLLGTGGYITHVWVDKDFRGDKSQIKIPNLYKALMQTAKQMGIHGILPEDKICPKCDQVTRIGSKPEKCPHCGQLLQPLTSKSFRIAQAKHDWNRSKNAENNPR